MTSLVERATNGLLGVAVGDALGATVEFMSPDRIRAEHGVHDQIIGGGAFGWRPGQGTDDTDLTWALTAAYLHPDGFSLARAADNMADWWRARPPDVGGTTRAALAAYATHRDPARSGRTSPRSAGNGSLMRALPTAIVRDDPDQRASEAASVSAITHAEPSTISACVAYVDIAHALLIGHEPDVAIALAGGRPGLHPAVDDILTDGRLHTLPVEQLATSGWVLHSLRCAVWALLQPDPADQLLIALVNRGDDADTTGAIAGGLLGLRAPTPWPEQWTSRLEYREQLTDAAPALVALRTDWCEGFCAALHDSP